MFKVNIATKPGHENHNEDFAGHKILDENNLTAVVADGMGGYSHGELASKVVVESFIKSVYENISEYDVKDCVMNAIKSANSEIGKITSEIKEQIGSAFAAVLIKKDILYLSWLGNVRVYLNRDGNIELLTRDHVLDTGYEIRLTRCLKGDSLRDDTPIRQIQLLNNDEICICTDGYYNKNVDDDSTMMKIVVTI